MKQLRALESVLRGVLYFSPVAANTDNEAFLQTTQSLLDCLDILKTQLGPALSGDLRARLRLTLRILESLQLAIEMASNDPQLAVVRIEAAKFALRLLSRAPPGAASTNLVVSDFINCLSPLVYAQARRRMPPASALAVYLTLQLISVSLLQDRDEFRSRAKQLVLDVMVRRPVYQLTLRRPLAAICELWGKIPVLRELNYLDYTLSVGDRFYYSLEGSRAPLA